jgi:hypothetical protein
VTEADDANLVPTTFATSFAGAQADLDDCAQYADLRDQVDGFVGQRILAALSDKQKDVLYPIESPSYWHPSFPDAPLLTDKVYRREVLAQMELARTSGRRGAIPLPSGTDWASFPTLSDVSAASPEEMPDDAGDLSDGASREPSLAGDPPLDVPTEEPGAIPLAWTPRELMEQAEHIPQAPVLAARPQAEAPRAPSAPLAETPMELPEQTASPAPAPAIPGTVPVYSASQRQADFLDVSFSHFLMIITY